MCSKKENKNKQNQTKQKKEKQLVYVWFNKIIYKKKKTQTEET